MIPNVVKGGNMYGLVNYLQGEGKFNEHENPHVIGGDDFLQAWYGVETLERSSVAEITDYIEEPRRTFGTKVQAKVTEWDPETGTKKTVGYRDAHVWHCSLSLPAEEGPLSNEQWSEISSDFMTKMGFTEASGKAPCRWVAIHHGASKNGNDHVHIAASMVREDGTRWDGRWRDFAAAQEACRELEAKYGLEKVDGAALGISERGEKPAERAAAKRAGMSETAPKELGHRIRMAAVASSSEAEWVRRSRAAGVVVKPFFAKGTTDVVRGYRAALKPTDYSGQLVFYSGGQLGRDLTLPRLREGWPQPSVESAQKAADEWQAAFRGKPTVHGGGPETKRLASTAPEVAASRFAAFNAQLAKVAVGDMAAWSDAARDVSGALSAWARYDQANAGELRAAAAMVSRSAQLKRPALPPGRRIKESPMGTAFLFMAARPEDRNRIAAALFMRQMLTTIRALAAHHAAVGDLRQALALEAGAVARLERVQGRLVGYSDAQPAAATSQRGAPAASPGQTTATAPALANPFRTNGPGTEPLPRKLPDPRKPVRPKSGQKPSRNGEDHER